MELYRQLRQVGLSLLTQVGVATLTVANACGGGSSGNFSDVSEVVGALDQHTVSSIDPSKIVIEQYYGLFTNYEDFRMLDVEPGPFRLQLYVYKNTKEREKAAEQVKEEGEGPFSLLEFTIFRGESNVLIFMYSDLGLK